MDLVMTKWIAMEGTALLANQKSRELKGRFPRAMLHAAKEFEQQLSIGEETGEAEYAGGVYLMPLSEGGIFTALWRLAQEAKSGLEVDLRKIPVKQETIEICEYFDLNPYNLLSKGSLLVAIPEGTAFTERLKRKGIEATVIGRLTKGNDRILWNDGNKRFLDRPQRDEIEKVMELYSVKERKDGLGNERTDIDVFGKKQPD